MNPLLYINPRTNIFGEMSIHANTNAFTIDDADEYHLVNQDIVTGISRLVTYVAGATGAITAFTDYSGTVAGTTLVTSNTHGLTTGQYISITGTTNYNGIYKATWVNDNTFYIVIAWVADDATGTFRRGAALIILRTGNYRVEHNESISVVVATQIFETGILINGVIQNKSTAHRRFAATDIGSMGGTAILACAAGDILQFGVQNEGASGNLTFDHLNVSVSLE
jgi:hypothetical protein